MKRPIIARLTVPTPSDKERRHEPRAPIELKVEYKRLNAFFADFTRNIGRGGTFIRTKKPLEIGTEFVFKLQVPALEAPLELRGRVQWLVRPGDARHGQEVGMGIGFVYDSEADRERVEAIVEKLMVESLGPDLFKKILAAWKKQDEGEK